MYPLKIYQGVFQMYKLKMMEEQLYLPLNYKDKTMSISDLYDSGFRKRNEDHFAAMVRIAMSDTVITEDEKKFLDRTARNLDISEDDYKVSAIMQEYFSNFIKTGNPNGKELPEWPIAKPNMESPMIMNIDTETKLVPASLDYRFRFFDEKEFPQQNLN